MDDAKSYAVPVAIGDVMGAGTVAEVMESKNARFKEGDIVTECLAGELISPMGLVGEIDPTIAPISLLLEFWNAWNDSLCWTIRHW